MKKLLFGIFILIVLVTMGCSRDREIKKPAVQKFINIATGGMAGTYFPLGVAIADILNSDIPGANASAQSTGASVANINLLQQGKVDLIFAQNDVVYYAANGQEMFKDKKVDDLRGIATLYPETIQVISLDKNLKSLNQLRGKRIAVGPQGSGNEANAKHILKEYGISFKDVIISNLSFADAIKALEEGSIDIAFVTAGQPTAAIEKLANEKEITLIGIDEQVASALIDKYPFYTRNVILANTYRNQSSAVQSVAVKAMLVVAARLDDRLTFDICKTIFANTERLTAAHPAAGHLNANNALDGMPVPLAGGAEKYYRGS